MRFVSVSIIAFSAFASAAPNAAHGHRAAHGNHQVVHSDLPAALAGRSTSYDGSCGAWNGASCPAGFCCGSNGWCGNAVEHCGAGCQADFGECGSGSSSQSSSESAPEPASSQPGQTSEYSTLAPVVASTDSKPSILPVTSDADQASSTTSSKSDPSTTAMAQKAPAEVPGRGHQSYGAPVPTLVTKTFPGASSADDSETGRPSDYLSPPAQPTSSSPAQPSSPPASSEQPEQPTSYGSPSSAPSATSASSISQTTSYGGPSPSQTSGGGGGGGGGGSNSQGGAYIKQYTGDGSSSSGWPSEDNWLSFDNLWEINQGIMKSSCSNAFSQADNTEQELSDLKSAIADISASSGVNKAFIFAIMMQESNGCVRAPTTTYSHSNPGLFQSNQGEGSCNDGSSAQNPCPESEIHQMVQDGVEGTASGDGLKQLLGKVSGDGAQQYYRAARMYNSGSVDSSGNLGLGVATHCYCSDIANRLAGWSQGVSTCDAQSVGA